MSDPSLSTETVEWQDPLYGDKPWLPDEPKVLITHPHDGHAPNETCLECTAEPKGLDPQPVIFRGSNHPSSRPIANPMRMLRLFPERYRFKPRPQYSQDLSDYENGAK